ncbi:MAG: aminopeptidase P family protein [bacterium]|nr:aminopeptidase P family protein [bacterium]
MEGGEGLNPRAERLATFAKVLRRRRLDVALVFGEANIRSLCDVVCDNGCLVVLPLSSRAAETSCFFVTDFRYVPMVHRVAPWLKTIELRRGETFAEVVKGILARRRIKVARVGYEGAISATRYLQLKKAFPQVRMADVGDDILSLRAVKSVDEITRIAAAEALNDEIWIRSRKDFKVGMTEKDLQRVIRAWMNALGDGEAFETIVCAGANAAECHHVPDDTVWRKGEPLLVDMGVKLDGVCSDMTRCLMPRNADVEYMKVYDVVLSANRAAIAAAKPGMTAGALDKVARDIITKAGYGKAFGHSLGHGVGYEIHELPTARPKDDTVLEPGMLVTIEPGIYLEGRLGVRIEDLVLITTTGCEVLSQSRK